jgi:hypothetical protein
MGSERVGVLEIPGDVFVVEHSWFTGIGLEEHRSSVGVARDNRREDAIVDVASAIVAPGDHSIAGRV